MILPFSTIINKKPTFFVEKIHKGFWLHELNMKAAIDPSVHYPPNYAFIAKSKVAAKIHTIREDKKNRWKAGVKIDFFINCRQKDMFRFAPVLPVVSVQNVEIRKVADDGHWNADFRLKVDGRNLTPSEINDLARCDGFEGAASFFEYFSTNYEGKIIHWTEKRY